jgi:hypothetical protein
MLALTVGLVLILAQAVLSLRNKVLTSTAPFFEGGFAFLAQTRQIMKI